MKHESAAFGALAFLVSSCAPAGDPGERTPEGSLASAISTSVVISQVYGGGGNTAAPYKNDFIELFNRGNAAVDLAGMSVQYESATGTGSWDVTPLSGVIEPGRYVLVQQDSGGNVGVALPAPDVADTTNMSATNGKVALVAGTGAIVGACPTGPEIVDVVGWGSATCFEGESPTPGLSNTSAAIRKAAGCRETDDNGDDFAELPPAPRNSAEPAASCAPSGLGMANPHPVGQGGVTRLTVAVHPGNNPESTGLAVTADLDVIQGSTSQTLFDDGTNGDAQAGDRVFSYEAFVPDAVMVFTSGLIPFSVSDAQARVDSSGAIVLTVATNAAPSAIGDPITLDEDVVTLFDVLANDSDPDGDPLSVTEITFAPRRGAATIVSNGALILYAPDPDDNGADSLEYRVTDTKGESDLATVSIFITAVNDAPIGAGDAYSASEDQALVIAAAAGVLANDSDPEANPVSAVPESGPANGMLALQADGSFTYTPDANFSGMDAFTYRPSDGTAPGNVTTVTIDVTPVEDAPVAADDAYDATEDVMLTVAAAAGVLANDTDADADDTLSAIEVTGPANGTLSLLADGSFTYTPDANFSGQDTFTYAANDGTSSSPAATVTIDVAAANDAPVAAADAYAGTEDTTLTVAAAAGVLANDTDLDPGAMLTASVVDPPDDGMLTLQPDGSFAYEPDADFAGTDSFSYVADDGTADSAAATVTLTIAAVNDAPVALADAYQTAEDTALVVGTGGALVNDVDVDGDLLTAVIETQPQSGTLTAGTDGGFTYTPDADFAGDDSFTYHATDGTTASSPVTVTVSVAAVNDLPSLPAAISPAPGEEVKRDDLLFSWTPSTDIDGDTLTYTVEILRGGQLVAEASTTATSTPLDTPLGKGDYTWRVAASDGQSSSGFTAESPFTIKGSGGGGGGGGGLFGCSTTGVPGPATPAGALVAAIGAVLLGRRRSAGRYA